MTIQKKDLVRELQAENSRCAMYMGFMYQVLQFTFLAIIALAVCAFTVDVTNDGFKVIFRLVLPICFYIFGVMYAFNAYALANCGIREEKIHSILFNAIDDEIDDAIAVDNDTYLIIAKNVATDRWVTLISYGVPLGFYLVLPPASVYIGYVMNTVKTNLPTFIIEMLPIVGLVVYYILMSVIIYKISKSHFGINEIQKNIEDSVDKKESSAFEIKEKSQSDF